MRTNLVMTRGTERTFSLNLADWEGNLPTLTNAVAELIVGKQFSKTATIDESAAVTGVCHRDDEPGDLLRSALVHRRGVLDAFAAKPVAQLVDGHNGCA